MEKKGQKLPQDEFEEFEMLKSTGFADWKKSDYERFLKAFRHYAEYDREEGNWKVDDIESVAEYVEKPAADCQAYFNVFVKRYRETKEKDLIVR